MSAPMSLAHLLDGIAPVAKDLALTDITLDSREVRSGGAFLACRGTRQHGLAFAPEAVRRGAAAILWESGDAPALPPLGGQVLVVEVPQLAARASLIAHRFFGAPSEQLDVIGVTGTNGKTTTAWLLAQALTACDRPAAYVGTLGLAFGGEQVAGELTTPDAVTLQRELAGLRDRGAQAVALEVSSHALVQQRVAAVRFDAAAFTNLTRDHLDFHGDMAAYAAAKASLFERPVRLRVFNVDDALGARLAARPEFQGRIACTRGEAAAVPGAGPCLAARNPQFSRDGLQFTLESSFGTATVRTSLVGEFNLDNVLAVLAVLLGSGVGLDAAVTAVENLSAPSGRLECFSAPGHPLVVVDYAHTPDALAQALRALRRHCQGRLVAVFGCGGDRDRGKRAQMGAVAARDADEVVLTDDNPRSEDPAAIVADILSGMPAGSARVLHDRREAILRAVGAAGPGDVVLVAGKGHESVQIVGAGRRPFRDQNVVREALARGSHS